MDDVQGMIKKGKIASIIISAGYSSRMFSFKPFLKFGELTAIELVVKTHKESGIGDIVVVTGHKGDEIRDKLMNSGVKCITNENYNQGMFSSVLKGIEALDADVSAFFLQPVDVPLVKMHTIKLLKNAYFRCNEGIIYPVFCGKKGHPPLIDCRYKQIIAGSGGEGGLKGILEKFTYDSIDVPVCDKAVLMDMDVKEDYERLLEYYNHPVPDSEECSSILSLHNTPDNIIRHCRKVAKVSMYILSMLKEKGHKLDAAALEAAALLHDISRSEKNHAQRGGILLREMGYEKVGLIIAAHMEIDVDENAEISENEILYMADKLVKEDRVISFDERFNESLEAYSGNREVMEKIRKRRDAACKIIKKIENITGKGFKYE